ncbi:protein ITPRID2-like isoform X3 [Haliotis cracherodii]|uniref:protein ITPRID2-like isoform X3 n=1 Tax=Haliotis cracherodii TaxID=6455 RepID=UPI0039E78919
MIMDKKKKRGSYFLSFRRHKKKKWDFEETANFDRNKNIQREAVTDLYVAQPIKEPGTSDLESEQPIGEPNTPSNSRRLVKALLNKRDYLRAQVRHFQQNFSGFRFIRRRGVAAREDETVTVPCCSDEDLPDFVTDGNRDCEIQDVCHGDAMAVKRAVDRSVSVEGAAHEAAMKEGGGTAGGPYGAAKPAGPGQRSAPSGAGQRSAPSVSDMMGKGVKSWTELMDSLSPKVDEPLPEMTKADDDAFVDDLPLGSEANTLSAVPNTVSATTAAPLDPRLASLKAAGNYGWTSFNSEVSGQTSGSSANSLDILLSQRNVDPEQMLRSLGFGFAHEQETPMLRVPVRFMQKSHASGINIADFLTEYPELQQVMMKKSGKWGSLSKSISTMLAMKSILGHTTAASPPSSSNNDITAAAESGPPDVESPQHVIHPRILSAENQRALASQGYYDCNVPRVERKDVRQGMTSDVHMRKPVLDAATRRERFQKTRSTKRWSMVESTDDAIENVDNGEMWISRSLDESKGRHSGTDFSSSMDSSDSPANDSRTSSISEKRRLFEEEMMKRSGEDLGSISRNREHQVNVLMDDDDEDGNYVVSGSPSKQSTIEKVASVIEVDSDRNDVRIVVSDTDPSARDVIDSGSVLPKSVNGTHSLLTIVNAQLERLSDSGSDYTLVESPRPSMDVEVSHPVLMQTLSKDSVFEESDRTDRSVSVSCQTSFDGHKLDENDNFSSAKVKSVIDDVKRSQDDLTRMGSVQSDSSGFGDADNTADLPAPENDRAWVASLGSSSESAGTLASSNTTILVHDVVTDMATQTSLSEHARHVTAMELTVPQDPKLNSFRRTFGENVEPNGDLSSRFISTFYIPPLSKTTPSSIIKQESETKVCGQSLVLGKTRVSVIVPNTSQKSTEIQNNSQEQKSQVKTVHTTKEVSVSPFYQIRAPLAKPEQFESDEDLRGSYLPSHWESPHSAARQGGGIRHVLEVSQQESARHTSAVSVLNLSVADSGEFGSRISLVEDDSDYSCSSVAESTASCSSGEILDYRKLVRLINQPVSYRGRHRSFTRYRPKKHIRDWPSLMRKKRIQEETRLLQHSLQKYKAELQVMETSCLLQYQLAYEDLAEDEREEVEELQLLWRELREQIYNMEQLLSHRMKAVTKGNDFFTFLSTLNVIQSMTELLKEQMYQQTVSSSLEQEQEAEEEEMREEGESQTSFTHSSPFLPPSPMHGYPSVFGLPGSGPPEYTPQHSLVEMRRSLIEEMREEMNRSTQQLQLDMQSKDNEIQRLNLELMMQTSWPSVRSRSTHSLPHRRSTRQTDV